MTRAAARPPPHSVVWVVSLDGAPPSRDQWVTGAFAGVVDGVPQLRVTSVRAITAPVDPYE